MEINEKLETRLNRVLDSRIEKAKGSQNEESESESESASQKLKETFSKRDDSSNLNEENGRIEDLLSSSQSSKKETCNGRKPSLGLSDEKQGADTTSENTDNKTRLEAYQERQAQMKEDGEKIARQYNSPFA